MSSNPRPMLFAYFFSGRMGGSVGAWVWVSGLCRCSQQCNSHSERMGSIEYISYPEHPRVWSTGGLDTTSTRGMSSTERPTTANTRRMSSVAPRVQAVLSVSNPEILGAQAASAAQRLELLRIFAVRNNPQILPVISLQVTIKYESFGRA